MLSQQVDSVVKMPEDEVVELLRAFADSRHKNEILDNESSCSEGINKLADIRRDIESRTTLGSSSNVWKAVSTLLSSFIHCSPKDAVESDRRYRFINAVLSLSMNLLGAGATAQDLAYSNIKDEVRSVLSDKSGSQETYGIVLKIYVNMCASNDKLKTALWADFLHEPSTEFESILNRLNDECYAILEIFVAGNIGTSTSRSKELVESVNGKFLVYHILDKVDKWSTSSTKQNFDFAFSIATALITHGLFPSVFNLAADSTEIPSDRQLALARLLDAYLSSTETISFVFGHGLAKLLYNDMFCAICKPLSIQTMTKKISNAQADRLASFMALTLESITALLSPSAEIRSLFVELNSVQEFIDLLKRADALVPRRTLKSGLPSDTGHSYEFPDMKRQLVGILALLVEGNRQVQDQIRDCGGLAVILSQCNIDDNNPFVREYAILCIKGILENNEENQAFVASLEAREAVSTDALHEAGYETSIIDGKLSLKRRPAE